MAMMYKKVWFGKELVEADSASLSIASSAVLYGLSVYTVFPVCIGEKGEKFAFRLDEHFKRLKNSARIIGIDGFEEKWTYPKFEAACRKLIDANSVDKDVFVRATIHVSSEIAGTRSRGLETVLSIFV
jgi:branched-chain amino acid aminotransferase